MMSLQRAMGQMIWGADLARVSPARDIASAAKCFLLLHR
jgi:hypothetical protein